MPPPSLGISVFSFVSSVPLGDSTRFGGNQGGRARGVATPSSISTEQGRLVFSFGFFGVAAAAGVVQEPSRQVAEARAQRDERGGGRGGRLQVVVQSAVQRSESGPAVRTGRGALRRLRAARLQQLGRQGAQSAGRHGQNVSVGPQLGQHGAAHLRRHVRPAR